MSTTFTRDPQPRIQYSGDGGRTAFAFPFPVLNSDDLLVYANGALATGFAITGLGQDAGGEIVFTQPPAAGTVITLLRRTKSIRETAFVDGGPFRATAVNAEFDRIMMMIQEDREEQTRSLRARPAEGSLDFCLPAAGERANKLLGFDSTGQPAAFGATDIPDSGEASGLLVTPSGGTVARALGEHLSEPFNVRDFGAMGDGVTDDSAAFEAALAQAAVRGSSVYVPASGNPYLLGASLSLDGAVMTGAGAGSMLKVGLATGFGIKLTGSGATLAHLRVLGPGASAWPQSAGEVELSGVSLDGIQVAESAENTGLEHVSVAGCHTGLALQGGIRAIVGCAFEFNRNGIEIRPGARSPVLAMNAHFLGCTRGLRVDGAATLRQMSVQGGSAVACAAAFELNAPPEGWRSVEIGNVAFASNLDVNVQAGPRQSLGLRGCEHDASGKRDGATVRLLAQGETAEAPSLIAETNNAQRTEVVTVELSNGSNLSLLQPGDLLVLAEDSDELDDLTTVLRATRAGVIHRVVHQSAATAEVELARAAISPLLEASDVVRVVGRSGTAVVDDVGTSAPAEDFIWLRADDHCRIFSTHNPMTAPQTVLDGASAELHHLPGIGGEPATLGGVAFSQGTINGAFARLLTFDIPHDAAVSFKPDSSIGMVHAFGHGAAGDRTGAVFTYRADTLGYTQLLARSTYELGGETVSDVDATGLTALTGTTGDDGKFTYSAHTDGRIYIENRLTGSRKVSLYVIGAPL